ncbi:MAG: hypothetical protein NTV86_20765 [Planctomycetota bacterium]|nr:hypothetical protein [Planctomycetota bacterium]
MFLTGKMMRTTLFDRLPRLKAFAGYSWRLRVFFAVVALAFLCLALVLFVLVAITASILLLVCAVCLVCALCFVGIGPRAVGPYRRVWIGHRTKRLLVGLLLAMLFCIQATDDVRRQSSNVPVAAATKATTYRDVATDVRVPLQTGKWRHILVTSHSGPQALVPNRCHFVVTSHTEEGLDVRATMLWRSQESGTYIAVPGHDYNPDTIVVSVEGDFDVEVPCQAQLTAASGIVRELQLLFGINHERVYLYRELTPSNLPGHLFPAGEFYSGILWSLPKDD